MPDDVVYQSTSHYAAEAASLVMKSAMAGLVLGAGRPKDPVHNLTAAVASAAVAIERAGGERADDSLTEHTPAWRTLHGAVARTLGPDGGDDGRFPEGAGLVGQILGDVAVQVHSQGILAGLADPDRAERLELSDRHVMEAVREGGDIEDLVRRRAAGAYDQLTPDQQDDVSESIATGGMIPLDLSRRIPQTERVAAMIEAQRPGADGDLGTLPAVSRDSLERAQALIERRAQPVDDVEMAVLAHARAFPDPTDEAGVIARGSALSNTMPAKGETPLEIATGIEHARLTVREAQGRVADGTSSDADRNVAVGRGHGTDQPVSFHDGGVPALSRARIAHQVVDIQREGMARLHGMDAEMSREGGIGRA